jgi:hypothetical protein
MAYDAELTGAILGVFIRAALGSYRQRAQHDNGIRGARSGAVSFIQCLGNALNFTRASTRSSPTVDL